jgi:hypothetical protein
MKRLILVLLILLPAGLMALTPPIPTIIAVPQVDWTLLTGTTSFTTIGEGEMKIIWANSNVWVYKNKPSIPAGYEIWKSTDKVNYTLKNSSTGIPWVDISQRCAIYYNTDFYDYYFWILGGATVNDVWQSASNDTWTEVQSNAPFGNRGYSQVVNYNGAMYLMSGLDGDASKLNNDVWISTDGVDWSLVTGNALWTPRDTATSFVYNGKLWLMGGDSWIGRYQSDIYNTTDGANWVKTRADDGVTNFQDGQGIVIGSNLFFVGLTNINHSRIYYITSDGSKIVLVGDLPSTSGGYYEGTFTDGSNIYLFMSNNTTNDIWKGSIFTPTPIPSFIPTPPVSNGLLKGYLVTTVYGSLHVWVGDAEFISWDLLYGESLKTPIPGVTIVPLY